MSIIVEYFTAPDDASAAEVLEAGPRRAFETVSCGNFLADVAMTEWETILTGRNPEAHEQAAWPRIVIDDEPSSSTQIFAASAELQTALAAASREELSAVAHQWVTEYSEDYGGVEPDIVAEILCELSELARSANLKSHTIYCWMC